MKRVAKNVTRNSPKIDTGSGFPRQFVARNHLSALEKKKLLLGESSKRSLTALFVTCSQHKEPNQWHKIPSTIRRRLKIKDCLLALNLIQNK
jgi:hypothetical protein